MEYPLSREEQLAMARCISSIRQQLQDVSELFSSRYGKESEIADVAVKALVSITVLEHDINHLSASSDAMEFDSDNSSVSESARLRH